METIIRYTLKIITPSFRHLLQHSSRRYILEHCSKLRRPKKLVILYVTLKALKNFKKFDLKKQLKLLKNLKFEKNKKKL